MEDVKVREMQIFDYKKKIAEAETKLKQQQVRLSYWRLSKPIPIKEHLFIKSRLFEYSCSISRST